jgi:hypothetical protein
VLASRIIQRPDRAHPCAELASLLYIRYQQTGDVSALDEAITLEREALHSQPPGHPNRSFTCSELGLLLFARWEQIGDLALLDEAIVLEREALALRPPGHPDRSSTCTGLGSFLHARYNQTGDVDLLDEAITLQREAIALQPPGHPNRSFTCTRLGSFLHARYNQTGDVALLDEAIVLEREALALRPPGHPDRSRSCASLASVLVSRYDRTGDLALLDEAIVLEREALALRPPGHPDRSRSCASLASILVSRYDRTGDLALLDEAIVLEREALALRPPALSWDIMLTLCRIHLLPKTPHFSIKVALEYSLELSNIPFAAFAILADGVNATLAKLWTFQDTWANDPAITETLTAVYCNLIDKQLDMRGSAPGPSSQLAASKSVGSTGSDGCVAALLAGRPAQAIELLDRAQGLLWVQAPRQCDPQMHNLPTELAQELETLLCTPIWSPRLPSELTASDLRHKRNSRIQTILREIRDMPGLERFMRGSTFPQLRKAAKEHPVVVLVAARGCTYALVISDETQDAPHSLRLEITSERLSLLVETRVLFLTRVPSSTPKSTEDVLAELWSEVVRPVLIHLQLQVCMSYDHVRHRRLIRFSQRASGRSRPRLHWCLTGDFASLPLHAAGIYDGPDQECCADYVVSSYTPTLAALIRARQVSRVRTIQEMRLVITTTGQTSHGMPPLKFDTKEAQSVVELARAAGASADVAPRLTSVSESLALIQSADILHHAGHFAHHESEPLQSRLYLDGSELSARDFLEAELAPSIFLAFISADEAARGRRRDTEPIAHLAGNMLFAGFENVIAAMS